MDGHGNKRKAQHHKAEKGDLDLGFVDITVKEARGLPKMDQRGLSDPYVVVTLENQDGQIMDKKQTKYIRQNLTPVWNEEFTMPIKSQEQILNFKMYDHDDIGKDDFMGQFKVAMTDIMREDWPDWFILKDVHGDDVIGEDGTEAQVYLVLRYTPHASKEQVALTKSIYDPGAGEEDLKLSIRAAAGTSPKKRVLLQLGSDWCVACKRMYFMLLDNRACSECIDEYYEYCLLDAEREQNFPVLKKLGDPQFYGFPVFVIIDSYGRFIHCQPTGELEKDPVSMGHQGPDPDKVFKFLITWREGGPMDQKLGELGPPTENAR